MSKTTTSLIVKFIATFIAVWVSLGLIDGNKIGYLLILAIIGTVVNYLFGDLIILPAAGNVVASIGDGLMGAFLTYLFHISVRGFVTSTTSYVVLFAVIAVFEFGFHIYIEKSPQVAP